MKIIVVDDKPQALSELIRVISKAAPQAEINGFEYPEAALEFFKGHKSNIAFLAVEMGQKSGVELAKRLKLLNPNINIIFLAGFKDYYKEAFELHASGYITKPVSVEMVKNELSELRYPIPKHRRIRVQAFGNFEVYIDNKPLSFKYNKTKEFFAYLIDRKGALCTNKEVIATIFDDNCEHNNYLRVLRKDLVDTLDFVGCEDIFVQQRGKQGIVPESICCDYYDWCEGEKTDIFWHGEYMAQYSWGEYTAAMLDRISAKGKR